MAGAGISAVQVGAQDIGFSSYQSASPYSFTLTVPPGVIGLKNVFALGLIANETVVASPTISIDIEPSTQPTSVAFQQNVATFGYVGEQRRVGITASYGDGSTLDISRSTGFSFSSNSPSVVSVDSTGRITAQGSGKAVVTVSYGSSSASLQAVSPLG